MIKIEGNFKREGGRLKQVGTIFGMNLYATCEMIKEKEVLLVMEKLLCAEICADPDLIQIMDSHGCGMQRETDIEKARGWERIKICPLRKAYRCRFEEELKGK